MKKLLLSLAVAASAVMTVQATERFVPRPVNAADYSISVWDRDYTYYKGISQLFEVPDGLDANADLRDQGCEVSVASDNPDLVSIAYGPNGRNFYVSYTCHKEMAGVANLTVSVTYNGETAANTLPVDVAWVRPKASIVHTLDIGTAGKPSAIDVLSQAVFWNYPTKAEEMKGCAVTLTKEPSHGTAEIKTGEEGYPVIVYTPDAKVADFTDDRMAYTVTHPRGTVSSEAELTVSIQHNLWASRVIELVPAPGQFVNTATADRAKAEASLLKHGTGFICSLGSFGGYIIYGFDYPVKNDPRNPYGIDFQISGNPLNVGTHKVWTEAGAVQVMKDLNGNGLPDDGEWYELAGSDYWLESSRRNIEMTYMNPHYDKRYTVPFVTSTGWNGAVLTNNFHNQPYYPLPENYPGVDRDQITFTGTLIAGVLDKRSPSYIEFWRNQAFGYADNWGSKLDPRNITNPYGQKYEYEAGYAMPQDGFDISWAVDRNGNHVELDQIDFVKVYTAVALNAGWLGEASTEPGCVVMTVPDPDYVAEDIYMNYAGITQLQVPVGKTCRYEGLVFCNGRPVKPDLAEGSRWSVEDETVGTIDADGVFTAKAAGTTRVRWQGTDRAIADEFDVQVVTLGRVLVDLEGHASGLSNTSVTCVEGETIYINVESETMATEVVNQTAANRYIYDRYRWENSDPAVGTVDNALFTALSPGTTNLTVISETDPELSATIEVTVESVPELEQLVDEIEITDDNLSGSLKASQMFVAGSNKSTVYIDGFDTDAGTTHASLDGDKTLRYEFAHGDYGTERLNLHLLSYGRRLERPLTLIYKDPSSGVESVSADGEAVASGEARWYDINGRYLGSNLDALSLPAGFYVVKRGDKSIKICL